MNVTVYYEGTNITTSVLSYDRDQTICTGIGALRLELRRNCPVTPQIYRTITLYEEGNKKGTYYIHTIDKSIPSNNLVLSCQDASIRVQEYYVAETYFIDYPSISSYWINKFLDEAGVNYQYDGVGTGNLLSNNTSLGISSAFDIIVPLLQQNGWYMACDSDNVMHIGKANVLTGNPVATITNDMILNIETTNHDKMFRNRVLVWGNGNSDAGRQVMAEIDRTGVYSNEYPGGCDSRTIVIANSNIPDDGAAYSLAAKAIKEFAVTDFEIMLDVAGELNVSLGDYVFVSSSYCNRGGTVTTVGSSLSRSGLVTHLVLNQRCPRLFAFFDYGGYVYVGTEGAGVWRKPLKWVHTWEDYSGGIPVNDRNITDLAIDNGAMACITTGGNSYLKTEVDSVWSLFKPALVETTTSGTIEHAAASGVARTCTFDKSSGDAIIGITIPPPPSGEPRSWVFYPHSTSVYTYEQLKDEEEIAGYELVSIDNNGNTNLASVIATYSGIVELWNTFYGERDYTCRNAEVYTISGYNYRKYSDGASGQGTSKWIPDEQILGDGRYIYIVRSLFQFGSGSDNPNTILSLYEIDTSDSMNYDLVTIQLEPGEVVNAGDASVIGERTICIPFAKGPPSAYTSNYNDLSFFSYNFKRRTQKIYSTGQDAIPLASYFLIYAGERRLYVLSTPSDSSTLYVDYFDPDETTVHRVAWGGTGGSRFGADWYSNWQISPKGYKLDADPTQFAFVMMASYWHEAEGEMLNAPIVVFYSLGTGLMYVHYGIADSIYGYGIEALANTAVAENWSIGHNGNMYTGVYFSQGPPDYGVYSQLYRTSRDGSGGCTFDGGDSAGIRSTAGNTEKAYVVTSEGTERIGIRDVDTGILLFALHESTNSITTVFPQLDDDTNNLITYNDYTGDVTSYQTWGIGSGVQHVYDMNLPASRQPCYGESVFDTDAKVAFVFDSIFVESWSYTANYMRLALGGVFPGSSQPRVVPVQYTKFAKDDAQILRGYKSFYTQVLDPNNPYSVECDGPAPFVVYGGTLYSGIVISGQQTGWNTGQIYLSTTGAEKTFSEVLLGNSLHSYVTDVRTFNAITASGSANYLIYPNPTETVIGSGVSNTEICLLDINAIASTPTTIIASGSLGQGFVLATFEGVANHVETTNTQDVPYIFVSVSGVAEDGRFFQKDSYDEGQEITEFIDRTNNLPSNSITCIRADDSL
jgi:hypothetical protein